MIKRFHSTAQSKSFEMGKKGPWCRYSDVEKLTQWQPIESCPKDGSTFMAYNAATGPYQTWYNDSEPDRPGTEYPLRTWTNASNRPKQGVWYPSPTHWRPMPEAPQ